MYPIPYILPANAITFSALRCEVELEEQMVFYVLTALALESSVFKLDLHL
jgi:hypothetical protein